MSCRCPGPKEGEGIIVGVVEGSDRGGRGGRGGERVRRGFKFLMIKNFDSGSK